MYKGFIERISKLVNAEYEKIDAIYNFEHGDEYEIAVCKILRQFLPNKYSICRDHIVSEDNSTAGDDIIIYDSNSYPNLRLLENDLSIKQYIPAEAVYAYIEVKHTMFLDTEDGQSLKKACQQVQAAKNIHRAKRSLNKLSGGFNIGGGMSVTPEKYWPDYRNPMFGCVIARKLGFTVAKNKKLQINTNIFKRYFDEQCTQLTTLPDLIIASDNIVAYPVISSGNDTHDLASPFFIPGKSTLMIHETSHNLAFGLINLLRALNWIIPADIPYTNLLTNALDI